MTALALATLLGLSKACAPQVAPTTLLSLAHAESGLDPLSIGVNSRPRRTLHPATRGEAVAQATALRARGASFDLGLTQINVGNLQRLGLSLTDAFDPCRNLASGAKVLAADYQTARRDAADDQAALGAALSRYNTGDPQRGFRNGYVARVFKAASHVAPTLVPAIASNPPSDAAVVLRATIAAGETTAAPLDVFERPRSATLVWEPLASQPVRTLVVAHPSRSGDLP